MSLGDEIDDKIIGRKNPFASALQPSWPADLRKIRQPIYRACEGRFQVERSKFVMIGNIIDDFSYPKAGLILPDDRQHGACPQ